MRFFYIQLAIVFLFSNYALSSPNADFWPLLSRQLTLNSKSTPKSSVIRRLKSIKKLDKYLKKGLKNEARRAYALDIIAALKMTHFTEHLLEEVINDEDGHTVSALNTLVDKDTFKKISENYKAKLKHNFDDLSAIALLAMLDSLTRWQIEIDETLIPKLLSHPFYEIRISTISYLESMVLKRKKKKYLSYAKDMLSLSPYQLRIRALEFFDKLPGGKIKVSLLSKCLDDKNNEVKNVCIKLKEQWALK